MVRIRVRFRVRVMGRVRVKGLKPGGSTLTTSPATDKRQDKNRKVWRKTRPDNASQAMEITTQDNAKTKIKIKTSTRTRTRTKLMTRQTQTQTQ